MTYVVTVPLVQVATSTGAAVQVTKGGEVPSNITKDALANLVELGYVERKAAAPAAAPAADSAGASPSPSSVKAILGDVGDDVEKAKAALAAEYESKGDKARSSLVDPLEAIINAAATSGDGDGSGA